MTRPEMMRRIATIDPAALAPAYRMILEGYGGSGLQFETGLTRTQISALFEWHTRHGKLFPAIAGGAA